MRKTAIALVAAALISGSASAQSSDHARILNLGPVALEPGAPIVVPTGGTAIAIPTGGGTAWLLTVQIDDIAYSFYPRQTRKVHLRDFLVGDNIRARIEKDKVYVTLADGRETHGKLLRRERVRSQTASAEAPGK